MGMGPVTQTQEMRNMALQLGGPSVGNRAISQEMFDANARAAAQTALQAPTNYGSPQDMINMMRSQTSSPQVQRPAVYKPFDLSELDRPMVQRPAVMPQQPSYQSSYQPSYQQQSYQQPQQYNPYQQYEQSLGSYNPYQMQSPFSYQQPMPQRTSSGPSQAIIGRSSQMRGTPNVMRRAEGGIASLMDDVE
jgi:hypothetical protein